MSTEEDKFKQSKRLQKDENAIKTNKEIVDPIIQAAGTDPQAFYREVKDKNSFDDGMALIYKNMA